MAQAFITQTSPHTVKRALPVGHELNMSWPEKTIIETYWIPRHGGYVRMGDKQVCEGLAGRGNTLTATPDDLLAVIRKEHQVQMRAYKRGS